MAFALCNCINSCYTVGQLNLVVLTLKGAILSGGAPAPATQPTAPVVPGPTGSGLPGTTAPQAAPSKPAGHVDDLD